MTRTDYERLLAAHARISPDDMRALLASLGLRVMKVYVLDEDKPGDKPSAIFALITTERFTRQMAPMLWQRLSEARLTFGPMTHWAYEWPWLRPSLIPDPRDEDAPIAA